MIFIRRRSAFSTTAIAVDTPRVVWYGGTDVLYRQSNGVLDAAIALPATPRGMVVANSGTRVGQGLLSARFSAKKNSQYVPVLAL
jgi:hypothetical protein